MQALKPKTPKVIVVFCQGTVVNSDLRVEPERFWDSTLLKKSFFCENFKA